MALVGEKGLHLTVTGYLCVMGCIISPRELPNRQLRKYTMGERLAESGELPNRQLRKSTSPPMPWRCCELPNRQLRKADVAGVHPAKSELPNRQQLSTFAMAGEADRSLR